MLDTASTARGGRSPLAKKRYRATLTVGRAGSATPAGEEAPYGGQGTAAAQPEGGQDRRWRDGAFVTKGGRRWKGRSGQAQAHPLCGLWHDSCLVEKGRRPRVGRH